MSNDESPNKGQDSMDQLLDHDYDGIRELDNPLPSWWLWSFLFSIMFSALYGIHYHLGGGGLSSSSELDMKMAAIQKVRDRAARNRKELSEEEYQVLLQSEETRAQGKAVYNQSCAACHGAQGEGLIGPNLTDAQWIHGGGTMREIAAVIRGGVVEKGMPAWEGVIQSQDIDAIVVFIKSLSTITQDSDSQANRTLNH